MHDSLAVAAFLDPSVVTLERFYVDVETTGELTAGETLGYSPIAGDLRRKPKLEQEHAKANMQIRGSAPTLASTRNSPVLRDKFVPNTNVAIRCGFRKVFRFADRRLSGKAEARDRTFLNTSRSDNEDGSVDLACRAFLLASVSLASAQEKRKVIIDQDAPGPAEPTSNPCCC